MSKEALPAKSAPVTASHFMLQSISAADGRFCKARRTATADMKMNTVIRGENHMNLIKCVVLTGLAIAAATLPAQAAMRVIYKAAGVTDSGGNALTGVATAIHCTNPTDNDQDIRAEIRAPNGVTVGDSTFTVAAKRTATFATKGTAAFAEDVVFNNTGTGRVDQGHVIVYATSREVFCSIVVHDAQNYPSHFSFRLHLVRFPLGGGGEE